MGRLVQKRPETVRSSLFVNRLLGKSCVKGIQQDAAFRNISLILKMHVIDADKLT